MLPESAVYSRGQTLPVVESVASMAAWVGELLRCEDGAGLGVAVVRCSGTLGQLPEKS